MDIEKLNKTQIVLLTLLVSFVTSIATGIVTVSLLQQAPPGVTQTVNRIIEKTVERVVEKDSSKGGEPKVVTKEKVVLVREADFVADAVKGAVPSLVSIYELRKKEVVEGEKKDTTSDEFDRIFVARGVFMGATIVMTDASIIKEGATYVVRSLATNAETAVTAIKTTNAGAYLTLEKAVGATLSSGESNSVQLGQTLIVLGGAERLRVTTGIVSDLERDNDGNLKSLTLNAEAISGNTLITMDGKLVAIYTGDTWVPLVK